MKALLLFLSAVCLTVYLPIYGQDTVLFHTIKGRVVDMETHERLLFVSVTLEGTNLSTITNREGEFALKIPVDGASDRVTFSYVGYRNRTLSLNWFRGGKQKLVSLERANILLPEVTVMQAEGEAVLREVIRNIPRNYSDVPNQMVGFYREMIRKNSTYVALVEAVLDIYKAPYISPATDKAKIYKGRKNTDKARLDTVFVRYQGGVTAALELDLAKNYDVIFSPDFASYYDVYCESVTMLDERPQYILAFDQKKGISDPLFRGKLYIDSETLAIIRADFYMNVENNEKATGIFLKRKPAGMRVKVEQAHYLIQFRPQGDKWYYQNSRVELYFKCRWPRRLFHSRYTLISEMAVTDRTENEGNKFPRKERLLPGDVISEKVADFEDREFWESYNIIEPEQSLENAIRRMARKLKRREME